MIDTKVGDCYTIQGFVFVLQHHGPELLCGSPWAWIYAPEWLRAAEPGATACGAHDRRMHFVKQADGAVRPLFRTGASAQKGVAR